MNYKSVAVIGTPSLFSALVHAGSAPKELFGKSIAVQWSEPLTGRYGGEQFTAKYRLHTTTDEPLQINRPDQSARSNELRGTLDCRYRQFDGGTRRTAIDFDSAIRAMRWTRRVAQREGEF
jgi:hypothetical protein